MGISKLQIGGIIGAVCLLLLVIALGVDELFTGEVKMDTPLGHLDTKFVCGWQESCTESDGHKTCGKYSDGGKDADKTETAGMFIFLLSCYMYACFSE